MNIGDTGAAVRTLQQRLTALGFTTAADGWYGPSTADAVRAYQGSIGLVQDGVAGPKTQAALSGQPTAHLLSQAALQAAADRLDVPVATVMAVNEVESRGEGFLPDGRPVILYERHIMHRRLAEAGKDADLLSGMYPELVNPKRGGYKGSAMEWYRLTLARQIDEDIANESTSWGAFQIMGYHWQELGFASIAGFVTVMARDEAAHLDAFIRFIEADPALLKALRARKWADFAKIYNGPDYKANLYDVKLQRAYERHAAVLAPQGEAA